MTKSFIFMSFILLAGASFAGELDGTDGLFGTEVIAMAEKQSFMSRCEMRWDEAIFKVDEYADRSSAVYIKESLAQSMSQMEPECRSQEQLSQICYNMSMGLFDADVCY